MFLSKVIIDYSLENNVKVSKRIKGIQRGNILIFNDDDNIMNIEILDNEVIIKRENKESINEMHFGSKSYSKYSLKEYSKSINIDIILIKLEINDNDILIKYKVEDEIKTFKIHYEVI